MQFGVCIGAGGLDQWGVGYSRIPNAAKLGFDYVELPLFQVAAMPDAAFEDELLWRLTDVGIPALACNCFFPGDVRLTGPERDEGKIAEYTERALERAERAGVQVVVLGSGDARNLSPETNTADGYQQFAASLRIAAPIAAKHGIKIAIEPLNRLESNIVTSYLAGLYAAALSGEPNVGTLVDAYHFGLGNEPLSDLSVCTPMHVHYADLLGRKVPKRAGEWGNMFFAALRQTGYDGLVSLEGGIDGEFDETAGVALEALREMTK